MKVASPTALLTANGRAEPLSRVPVLAFPDFRDLVARSVRDGAGLAALFAHPGDGGFSLFAVLMEAGTGGLRITSARIGSSYASLTPDCPAAHWFEREIFERW